VIHVLPGNARQHHARAPVPFPERPDRRVRPRFLPPYAPHLNPTERLWGVMHRHVRRNRFHADLRQFTEAILHFFDGTLPGEREAIAESVTDSFRVITHDGYRMAARPRPCGGRISPESTVQFSSASIFRDSYRLLTKTQHS